MPGAGNTASSPVSMPVAEAHMAVRPLMGELSLTVACIPGTFQMKNVCSRQGRRDKRYLEAVVVIGQRMRPIKLRRQ